MNGKIFFNSVVAAGVAAVFVSGVWAGDLQAAQSLGGGAGSGELTSLGERTLSYGFGEEIDPVKFQSPCGDGGFSAWMGGGTDLLVGCSDGTVVRYELSLDGAVAEGESDTGAGAGLRMLGAGRFDGPVGSFFQADGGVWVKTTRTEAVPLSQGGWSGGLPGAGDLSGAGLVAGGALVGGVDLAPVAGSGLEEGVRQAGEEEEAHVGRVVEVRIGEVVVDMGMNHGLTPKSKVEIFTQVDEDMGEGATGIYTATLAVALVKTVTDERAVVKMGLNEQVPVDAMVRLSNLPLTAKPYAPGTPGGITTVQFTLRPFLPLSTKGFGTMADAAVSYRAAGNWAVHLQMEPLGFAFANTGDILSLAANVIVAYDTRLFELGLGLGWASITGVPLTDDWTVPTQSYLGDQPTGLSLVQSARLGALDGANIAMKNLFLMYQERFEFGGTFASIQYPLLFLGDSNWAVLRFATADTGFVELGLRHLLRGNGGHGSIFLTPTVGTTWLTGYVESAAICDEYHWGPNIDDDDLPTKSTGAKPAKCSKSVTYAGPMVGLSLEWRI